MSFVAVIGSAVFAFGPVPAAPHPEVQVPALQCLAEPKAEAARATYSAYIEEFTLDTIKDKKPDPELVSLIEAEIAQCADRYSWAEGSANFGRLWALGRLMQSGAWHNIPLGVEDRAKLVAALDDRGESGVALAALMTRSKTANGYVISWTKELLEETGLDDNEEFGEFLGIYMMGTYFRRYAREKFAELNVQEQD